MEIALPIEVERHIQDSVTSGLYASKEEMVCVALQLLRERIDSLKSDIAYGIEQADAKDFSSLSIAELKAQGHQMLARS